MTDASFNRRSTRIMKALFQATIRQRMMTVSSGDQTEKSMR